MHRTTERTVRSESGHPEGNYKLAQSGSSGKALRLLADVQASTTKSTEAALCLYSSIGLAAMCRMLLLARGAALVLAFQLAKL